MIEGTDVMVLDGEPSSWNRWEGRLRHADPVGWVVVAHVVLLALFSEMSNPVVVLALGAVLLVYRWALKALASRDVGNLNSAMSMACSVGSLALVGGIVAFDGGTESPLFFSMLIVVVWEVVISPFRRFVWLAVTSLSVYAAVIFLVPDVTAASLLRMGVFAAFLLLLGWARGVSENWQRESSRAKALAAEIAESSPIGFALYDAETQRCLYLNRAAQGLGLGDVDAGRLIRSGGEDEATFPEVLGLVAASGDPDPPSVYVAGVDGEATRFIRLGASLHRVRGGSGMLIVHAEDVTGQVSVGEQHRRFLESANHQFRTPLSPILAYADLIVAGELEGGELREAAKAIGEGGQRIERLLDRIGTLLRLQRAARRTGVLIPMSDLIERYLLAEHPDLAPFLAVEGDLTLAARCDPRPLATALVELIDNGRQHGTPPVTLSIQPMDGGVSLRIWDGGRGPDIDPDVGLGDAWSLFSRPEVMPPETGGRLGITFAHALVTAGGGSLRFERARDAWAYILELGGGGGRAHWGRKLGAGWAADGDPLRAVPGWSHRTGHRRRRYVGARVTCSHGWELRPASGASRGQLSSRASREHPGKKSPRRTLLMNSRCCSGVTTLTWFSPVLLTGIPHLAVDDPEFPDAARSMLGVQSCGGLEGF